MAIVIQSWHASQTALEENRFLRREISLLVDRVGEDTVIEEDEMTAVHDELVVMRRHIRELESALANAQAEIEDLRRGAVAAAAPPAQSLSSSKRKPYGLLCIDTMDSDAESDDTESAASDGDDCGALRIKKHERRTSGSSRLAVAAVASDDDNDKDEYSADEPVMETIVVECVDGGQADSQAIDGSGSSTIGSAVETADDSTVRGRPASAM